MKDFDSQNRASGGHPPSGAQPYFISITRLRLRSWLFLPIFFIRANQCVKQATQSAGFVEGATLGGSGLIFWTVTLWRDAAAMKAYRGSGAHRDVMPRFANWCSEGATANYETEEASIPTPAEMHKTLIARGRPSPVKHPTPNHESMSFPAPDSGGLRINKFKAVKTL